MLGFHAISEAPLSAQALTQHNASASLSGNATLTLPVVTHYAKAALTSDSPFSRGFTQGFQVGTLLTGKAVVTQQGLNSAVILSASGTVEKLASTLLETNATFQPHVTALVTSLQSIGSLAGKSVLLHSGRSSLNTLVTLIHNGSRPDIVSFTAHVDKGMLIDARMSKTLNLVGYVDKQLSVESQIDLNCGISAYIDKVVEKTLIRER
jgi:hypothetical protein|tara:strand:+ start:39 stop:662 length:624 start_codon:yes stop_codon:yes gene_type:complete